MEIGLAIGQDRLQHFAAERLQFAIGVRIETPAGFGFAGDGIENFDLRVDVIPEFLHSLSGGVLSTQFGS